MQSKDSKYNSKRTQKTVIFLKKEHKELLEYVSRIENFSGYVVELLKNEMEKEK